MKKRTFLKQIGLGSLALAGGSSTAAARENSKFFQQKQNVSFGFG
jgi:hypothetical protein